jgi:hypothetical protein
VARVQLSLRTIPWEFDKPIQFGAVKLRKCAGCPHNSESDRTLFGIDEDATNPLGYCLHASCYNAKHEAAEAAKEQVFKKVNARQDQTPEAICKVSPDWLKESTVVGYVKRNLEKARSSENGKPAQKPKASPTGRPLTEHEVALGNFVEAFNAWEQRAYATVLKGINADPLHRVCWCVLLGVPVIWDHPRVQQPRVHGHSVEPSTEEPVIPAFSNSLEEAIELAFKGTRNAWVELLKDHEQIDPDQRGGLGIPHPRAIELLAEAVKVKLPAAPQWTPVAKGPTPAAEVRPQSAGAVTA